MREVLGCVHEGVMVQEHGLGAEDAGVTTLLTMGATKFRALVVWMARSGLFTGGTTVMGTVGAEMFHGSTCVASSQND